MKSLLRVAVLVSCLASAHAFVLPRVKQRAGLLVGKSSLLRISAASLDAVADAIVFSDIHSTVPVLLSFDNADISSAFDLATFIPQPFWLLMILLPNLGVTKKIMGSWYPIFGCSLIHLFIVIVSASQDQGTAPILEFADVFDPSGDPQGAMLGMMRYPNFVSEEWSHVLTWDLLVGRLIWLDGIERGIFTCHSVLLCNLIGPPGLLLHALTSLAYGKAPLPLPSPGLLGGDEPE